MSLQEQLEQLRDWGFTQIEVVHDSDDNNYISSIDSDNGSEICFEIGCKKQEMRDKVMKRRREFKTNYDGIAARARANEWQAEIEAARAQL